jgi:hypothetical protein
MTPSGGKLIDGTAFHDGVAFNELWERRHTLIRTATGNPNRANAAPSRH